MKIISRRGRAAQPVTAAPVLSQAVDFINRYLTVDGSLGGTVKLTLNTPQERLINALSSHANVISKMPRQAGQTTALLAYLTWKCMHVAGRSMVMATPNSPMANTALNAVKGMVASVPAAIRPGISNMRVDITFTNGSSINIMPAEVLTRGILTNGLKFDDVLISDMAYLHPQTQGVTFSTVSSMLGASSQLIISSTPRQAGDTFHKLWTQAKSGSQLVPVEACWQDYMPASTYLKWAQQLDQVTIRRELEAEFV